MFSALCTTCFAFPFPPLNPFEIWKSFNAHIQILFPLLYYFLKSAKVSFFTSCKIPFVVS